ncbi:MAG: hypothetical protein JSV49_10625 [Thermoplasmata archaeon]|nr:MAG: hypothetical protein JSV49_10625 [Thermoplasmata archaeon]
MVNVEIENIIASATIADALDLPKIAETIEGAEYNPDRFPGVVLKFESPRVVVLLFEKGKMMCTGGRSLKDVQEVMDSVFDTLTSQQLLVPIGEGGEAGADKAKGAKGEGGKGGEGPKKGKEPAAPPETPEKPQ